MKKNRIYLIVAYLISFIGALIGWIAFAVGTKFLLDVLKEKYGDKLTQTKKIVLVIIAIVIYAAYNYFIVTPLINH